MDHPALSPTVLATSPTCTPARPYARGESALGLGRPLPLRGGAALHPGGVAETLGLEWMPGVASAVIAACIAQARSGSPWFWMRPTALVAAPGGGRRHAARRIACRAGVPFAAIDVAGPDGGDRLVPPRRAGEVGLPTAPVLVMAAAGCANPVLLVEGADEATEETVETLCAMIDPATCACRTEESLGAVVDLRHVTWLVQTFDAEGLPARLSGLLAPVDAAPEKGGREARVLSMIIEATEDLGVDDLSAAEAAQIIDGLVREQQGWGRATLFERTQDAVLAAVRER